MDIIIYGMAVIGLLVVMVVVYYMLDEFVRAAKNSHRLATVSWHDVHGSRLFPYRFWWHVFLNEYGSCYSDKIIGNFVINHDPDIPLSRYE